MQAIKTLNFIHYFVQIFLLVILLVSTNDSKFILMNFLNITICFIMVLRFLLTLFLGYFGLCESYEIIFMKKLITPYNIFKISFRSVLDLYVIFCRLHTCVFTDIIFFLQLYNVGKNKQRQKNSPSTNLKTMNILFEYLIEVVENVNKKLEVLKFLFCLFLFLRCVFFT